MTTKTGTKTKPSSARAVRLLAVVLTLVLLAAALAGCKKDNQPENEIAPQMPYAVPGFTMLEKVPGAELGNGLSVLCAGRYSGAYWEDGSDEQVQDVLTLVVHNNGEQLMEYGEISLVVGKKTAEFTFSGLPAGSTVLVQEKNRMTATDKTNASDFSLEAYAFPGAIQLDFGGEFAIYPSDGVLNVENISGTDISGDVSVFYKHFEYGLFLGGITYRARFSGGIRSGEVKQSMQKHFRLDTGAILYMAYGE